MCSPARGGHFDACLSIGRDQLEISPYGQGGTKKPAPPDNPSP